MTTLKTSSDDWYNFTERADYIHRKYSDARTSDEHNRQKLSAEDLIDFMRSKYGYDKNVESIISQDYLDRM